jgi:hypothetical protein
LPSCDPPGENLKVTSGTRASVWERRAWAAGIVFVVALLAEGAISAGLPINQDDSARKIARQLQDHRQTVLVAAYFSAVYAVTFVIYLAKLHDLLRRVCPPPGTLHSLVLIGGVLLVAFHGVSDIGIYGLLGGKIATYAAHRDQGLSYTLYLLTFALDSVGDVLRVSDRDRTLARPNPTAAALACLDRCERRHVPVRAGLRPRRRHRDLRLGTRPHRLRVLPDLRPAQQRDLAKRPRLCSLDVGGEVPALDGLTMAAIRAEPPMPREALALPRGAT